MFVKLSTDWFAIRINKDFANRRLMTETLALIIATT
jgi:hypothetical protein